MNHKSVIEIRPEGLTVRIESSHAAGCCELLESAGTVIRHLARIDESKRTAATDLALRTYGETAD